MSATDENAPSRAGTTNIFRPPPNLPADKAGPNRFLIRGLVVVWILVFAVLIIAVTQPSAA